MNQKKVIVITLIFLGMLALLIFVVYKNINGFNGQAVSQNILYITQPVTSFSGTVEKVSGNTITVSQKVTASQNIIPPAPPAANPANQPSPFPTPKTATLTYHIVVTDKTQISPTPLFVPYVFKTTTLPGAPALPAATFNLTVQDIKIGQLITVHTAKDLRTLSGDTVEATTINLPPIANMVNGKIISVTNNTLILKAFTPVTGGPGPMGAVNTAPSAPQEKEYRITITSDTEISRMSYPTSPMNPGEMPQPPKPEKFSAADLKKDMQVTVYTAEDVNETGNLTALRIEPAVIMPTPAVALPPPQISPLVPSVTSSPSGTNTITPEKK